MSLAYNIAKFVVGLEPERLPEKVIEKLRVCLLNGVGMAFASYNHPPVKAAHAAAIAMDGNLPRGASLLGRNFRTSVSGAGAANTTLFYAGGQCDTCGTVHVGLIVQPMLLAMIEAGEGSLDRLLPSMLAGYEVAGLLDQEFGRHTAARGIRGTQVYGTVGAAAAAAKMLDLDVQRTAYALGIAASFSGGLMQTFIDGADDSRHQPAIAVRSGLTAAYLAKSGVRGSDYSIEGKAGLVRAFADVECNVNKLSSALGRDWSILRVTFKPFPVCAFNQTPVIGAQALSAKISDKGIAGIRVRMNPFETKYAGMDSKGPFDSLTGTAMSIPFCIAKTLLRGAPYVLPDMLVFDDTEVNELAQKVDLITDAGVPNLSAIIEVTLNDGDTIIQDQKMTNKDYVFDRITIRETVRRVGRGVGVPETAYDLLEDFINGLPHGDIRQIVDAFELVSNPQPVTA